MSDETRTAVPRPAPEEVTCTAAPAAHAAAAGPPTLPTPPPGYELLHEIGSGGMGVVYRARDLAFDRDVAVKLLHERGTLQASWVRRFLDEARITGQLQHPGIPAAHQVGTLPDGCPFLVMKLIKGRTLDDLLKKRADPAADRGRFLAVFEQVCQAVGYAHARGVIHRNLKPHNVMVGAFGEVQVMDWGLAKVLSAGRAAPEAAEPLQTTEIRLLRGAESETQSGSLLGTPAFMPPEQAVGAVEQLDARSDVFGLGAILCVILTGKPPYVAATAEATYVLAARGKLDEAFARLAGCGAEPELVTLCQRCLSPEQADRPADAGAVARAVAELRAAADERAHRAEVERERAQVQAAEQRKRRQVQLVVAVLVGLLLLGGGTVVRWREQRAESERKRLERDTEAVAALLGQCEAALGAEDTATAGLTLGQAEQRMGEEGTEQLHARLARCRADLNLLRELDEVDTFRWTPVPVPGSSQFPKVKAITARWRKALSGYGVQPGDTPPAEAASQVSGSLIRDRLESLLDQWLVQEPSPWLRAVLQECDADPYRDAVRDALAAGAPKRVAELAGQPEALRQPGRFAAALGQDGRAITDVRRREILAVALRGRPGDLTLLMALGGAYPIERRAGADERVRWFQAAAAVQPRSIAAHTGLGAALWDRDDRAGAMTEYRESVRLGPHFAPSHIVLGSALEQTGDLDGAIATYQEAIRLDPQDAIPHNRLAWVLSTGPRTVRDGKRALELATRACELNQWQNFWYVDTLAAAYAEVGDFDRAIEYLRKALALPNLSTWQRQVSQQQLGRYTQKKPYYNPDLADPAPKGSQKPLAEYEEAIRVDPKNAVAHYALGEVLRAKNHLDQAMAEYQEAIRLDPQLARAHIGLAHVLEGKHDLRGAVAAYKEAIRLDPNSAHGLHAIAEILADGPEGLRDGREAVRYATRACELTRWENADCLDTLAAAYSQVGDLDKAIENAKMTLRLGSESARTHLLLGVALQARKDDAGAIAAYKEAVRFAPDSATAHHHLAALLAGGPEGLRDGREAVRCATRACELTRWENAGCLDTLAAAHAQAGDLDKAIEYERKALALPSCTPGERKQFQGQLDSYMQKRSLRNVPASPPR